jgi:hypothetical protein
MDIGKVGVTFFAVVAVVALLVASPVLSKLLVYPRTEFFSEMWILGSNHTAEGYPYNISKGANYDVFLGIGNQLGYCAYYVVEVKFRNETQSAPASFGPVDGRNPSSLPSLFNISAFVADGQNWELPVSFSFDYGVSLDKASVVFHNLTLNNQVLSLEGYITSWNATRSAFYGNLVFELWIYDAQATALSYHGRYVDLKLNMTAY